MQPIPIAYMPSIPPPCFSLRSRRETNTVDTANSRFEEHWKTDSPALLTSLRGVNGTERYQDMNPIPSRLYREDMRAAQPYVVPAANSEQVKQALWYQKQIATVLGKIQEIDMEIQSQTDYFKQAELRRQLGKSQELYELLLTQQRGQAVDSIAQNPFFDKYDVPGDSRNIVRELRTSVTEDIVDRGVVESQKLYKREFQNRWVPAHFNEREGLNSLDAYELMRPQFNDQEKVYFS